MYEISTHALTWSATCLLHNTVKIVHNFNSRAHVERDDHFPNDLETSCLISTHALTWSATAERYALCLPAVISTHALTWSATLTSKPLAAAQAFQLTRSRGARPVGTFGWQREHYISTHALTWSATKRFSIRLRRDSEFQLTRSRGARPSLYSSPSSCISNFNSRAHVERDAFGLLLLFVSALFQLTRSRGARRNKRRLHSRPTTRFQLTRSRGARREGLLDEIIDQLDFNSRAHVERDSFVRHLRVYFLVISTHALTWSATKNWRKSQWKKSISTHALTWSATKPGRRIIPPGKISTHALTWSATTSAG